MIDETIVAVVADHGGYRNTHGITPPMIAEVYVPLLLRGMMRINYTAKTLPSCNRFVINKPIYQDAFAWLLTALIVDDKPVGSCQQTCCKLIVKTCYPQACCKFFQQVITSLQMASCNKPDFNRLVAAR